MAIQEIVELTADDRQLLDSLARVNSRLRKLEGAAQRTGNAISGASGSRGMSGFISAARTGANVALKVARGFYDLAANAAKAAGIIGGSLIAGFKALSSGFTDLTSGLQNVIQIEMNRPFMRLATGIKAASGGIIDMNTALDMARRGKGITGVDDEDIKRLGRMATLYALNNNRMKDTASIADQLFKAIEKGQVEEEFFAIDSQLASIVKNINEAHKGSDLLTRRQLVLQAVMKQLGRVGSDLDEKLNNPMVKLYTLVENIKESSQGLGEILTGMLKTVGAVAAPLIGGFGALAFAGPIVGPLGVIVGGILSAALGTFVVKAMGALGGEGKEGAKERLGRYSDMIQLGVGAALQRLFAGGGAMKLPISGELFESIWGEPGAKSRRQAREFLTPFVKGADVLTSFADGFVESFDAQGINKYIKDNLFYLQAFTGDIGLMKDGANSLGRILGTLGNMLAKILLRLIDTILKLIDTLTIGGKGKKLAKEKEIEATASKVEELARKYKELEKQDPNKVLRIIPGLWGWGEKEHTVKDEMRWLQTILKGYGFELEKKRKELKELEERKEPEQLGALKQGTVIYAQNVILDPKGVGGNQAALALKAAPHDDGNESSKTGLGPMRLPPKPADEKEMWLRMLHHLETISNNTQEMAIQRLVDL